MNLESNQASSSADDPANENRHAEAEMARLLIRQFRLWMAGCALQFIFVNGIYWMSGNKSVSIFLFFMILTAALVGGVVSKVFLEDRSSRFVTAPLGICILVELSIVFEKFADVFYGHRIGFPPFAIIVVVAATWAYLMVDGALRQSRLLPILGSGLIGSLHLKAVAHEASSPNCISSRASSDRRGHVRTYWPHAI